MKLPNWKVVLAWLAVLTAWAPAQINGQINGGGGGGSPAFSAITSGTNTAAAMVLSTGSSLSTSGTVTPTLSPTATANVSTGTDGLDLFTSGVASSGNNYYSPNFHLRGTYWTGAASANTDWEIFGLPSSATTSFLVFGTSINGGAYNTSASLGPTAVWAGEAFSVSAGGQTPGTCGNCFYLANANNPSISAGSAQVASYQSTFAKVLVPLISAGTTFAFASGTGACATTSTLVGGVQAGNITCTGTTGASTLTLTLAATTTAYSCVTRDVTTGADTGAQTGAISTTSVTFTYTAVAANDVIQFSCLGY